MIERVGIILCLLVFGCQTPQSELPILSYTISSSGDKEYYSIEYQGHYQNQLGNTFTTENIQDKIILANFFFTRCPSICPPMREQLIDIADAFKNEPDLLLVSHTIDPEYDHTDILKSYAEHTGVSSGQWQFLRASKEDTQSLAKQFMTNFKPTEDGIDFYHSSYAALVDKDQNIRGFYNILLKEELVRLKQDLNHLLKKQYN